MKLDNSAHFEHILKALIAVSNLMKIRPKGVSMYLVLEFS